MTGILLKDILILKKHMRTVFFSLLFMAVIFAVTSGVNAVAGMVPIYFSMFVMSTFTYDDLAKWNRYALSMPLGRDNIVMSKYVLSVLLSVLGAIASYIICVIVLLVQGNPITEESLIAVLASALTAIILSAVMLPLYFKFGAEKARMFFMILVLVPVGAAFLLHNLGVPLPNDKEILIMLKMIPIIAAAVLVLSYFISLKIFSKKEF